MSKRQSFSREFKLSEAGLDILVLKSWPGVKPRKPLASLQNAH